MAKQRIMHGATIDAVTPEELAEEFTRQGRPNVVFGLGGGNIEELMDDMPMRGTRRQITSMDRGDGSDNFVIPAAVAVDMCDFDPARIAGSIINIGANPAFVYLAYAKRINNQGGQGNVSRCVVGFLAAGGGSWDFKLSNDVWCGPVSIFSTLGTTLVWGTH